MKTMMIVVLLLITGNFLRAQSQQVLPAIPSGTADSVLIPESQTIDLQLLVVEAMIRNPDIQASVSQMDALDAKISQEGTLPDPELNFTQENMPDFNFSQAMWSRLELTQSIPFPTKLSTQTRLARIRADHAHHDHLETINDVVSRVKSSYYELWLVQQNLVLDRENERLMSQILKIAGTKYGVGSVPLQDVLKAQVELAVIQNEIVGLRQKELSAKARLMSYCNRAQEDTLGYAVISEEVVFIANLDSLLLLAEQQRPMVIHDSMGVAEEETMLSLAKKEYLPDLRLAVERITSPTSQPEGWSISAGISLPFAPWTLGKANSRIEEATAGLRRATSQYLATRSMVAANVKDLYYKAEAAKRQLDTYRVAILPQSLQALKASSSAYQTGSTDFLMLIDTYRTNVNITKEYFMLRMQFEQHVAELEREVGTQNVAEGIYERSSQ